MGLGGLGLGGLRVGGWGEEGEGLFAGLGGLDGEVGEDFFVDVAGVEGDHFFGDFGAEGVDLSEDVREVHDVRHREGWVDGFHVGAEEEAEEGFVGGGGSATGEDEEARGVLSLES